MAQARVDPMSAAYFALGLWAIILLVLLVVILGGH